MDAQNYAKCVNEARRGRQPVRSPAARVSSPLALARRPDNAKPSSPTRSTIQPTGVVEEETTAFPTLEEAAISVIANSPSLPPRTRGRSSSIHSGGAVEAAQKRDVRIAPAPQVHRSPSAFIQEFTTSLSSMPRLRVPKPGPAKLKPNSTCQEWLQAALRNQYLPEHIMKKVCEDVKAILMEESNVQPVSTPVTVCGDLHGQFYDVIELFRVAGGIPSDESVPEASPAPKGVISSDDIEPPTEITDPKLKKKMKKLSVGDGSSSATTMVINEEGDAADTEEEHRGRSRGPVDTGTLGPPKEGDSGIPGNQNYIFLGDFVDRGYFSLETFTLLLCLKLCYPSRITLIRGNHESRQITQVYGFYEECNQKYGNSSVWKSCCQVFDFLILSAVIDGKILCVHGGLSPEIRTVDQIRVIARAQEIPHEGAFCDLVWSDPEDIGTWAISPRGAGWLFGDKVAREFNHVNDFEVIARAHQLVNEGYKWHFDDKSVVTVWSAPNYCYRCGNVASIMNVGEDLKPKFSIFSAVPDNERAVPVASGRRNDYFL